MSKVPISFKEVTIRVPSSYQYTCDTCGYVFNKGERKITYSDKDGTKYACYDKPCCAFSKPKTHEYVWSDKKRCYVWREIHL